MRVFLILCLSPLSQVMSQACEQKDSTERFIVEGTSGNEYRTCEWAVRFQKKNRCGLEVVRVNCPVSCDIPCPSSRPSLQPTVSPSPSALPSLAPTPLHSTAPSWCEDTGDSFYDGNSVRRTCEWANRLATAVRCNDDTVRHNCPVTCGDCPGSASPSITQAPSTSPTELISCDDLQDSTDRFYVPYTGGNGNRTCAWAGRIATRSRCEIEVVEKHCPVTCNIPCNRGGAPPIIPVKSERAPQNNGNETLLGIIIPCVILVLLALLIGFLARRRGNHLISEEKRSQRIVIETDDEGMRIPPFIHANSPTNLSSLDEEPSPRNVSVKEFMTPSNDFVAYESVHISNPSAMSYASSDLLGARRTPSFISDARGDIGRIIPPSRHQDVHSCDNVKCHICSGHKKIKVIQVSDNPTMVSQMGASESTSESGLFGASFETENDDDGSSISDYVY